MRLPTPTPLVQPIIPGIVVALFFQCMSALLSPINRDRGGIRWKLVIHTAALFLNATISAAIGLYILSESYIDGREFSGSGGLYPGPFGYSILPKFLVLSIIADPVVQVNQWLVDGFLVSSVMNAAIQVLIIGLCYSCIVATSYTG